HAQPAPARCAGTWRRRVPAPAGRPGEARGVVRLAPAVLGRPAHHRPRAWPCAPVAGHRARHARGKHEPGDRAAAGRAGQRASAAYRSTAVFAGAFRMSQPVLDFDLVVLGGGSGGLAAAFRAAGHGARVAILEPGELGGTCVNVGCVPKKAMWIAAELAGSIALASQLGFDVSASPGLDWPALIASRQRYIHGIHGSYRRRLDEAGIMLLPSRGRLHDAHTIECENGTRLRGRHVLIATGSRPSRPDVPGAALAGVSDDFFDLHEPPGRVALVGG